MCISEMWSFNENSCGNVNRNCTRFIMEECNSAVAVTSASTLVLPFLLIQEWSGCQTFRSIRLHVH